MEPGFTSYNPLVHTLSALLYMSEVSSMQARLDKHATNEVLTDLGMALTSRIQENLDKDRYPLTLRCSSQTQICEHTENLYRQNLVLESSNNSDPRHSFQHVVLVCFPIGFLEFA